MRSTRTSLRPCAAWDTGIGLSERKVASRALVFSGMNPSTRRRFLQSSTLAASTLTAPSLFAQGASQKLRIGLIGPGGMGTNHLKQLAKDTDVELAWLCEVDGKRLEVAAKMAQDLCHTAPKTTKDMRNVLDDQSVDAVFIATPDHWHAPATLLALDAGKHVYVEKPCSHVLHEGRLMV